MYNRTDVMLLYDGSFEGLLTCIFNCYYDKIDPIDITPYDKVSQFVLCENIYIDTDMTKYERVYSAIGTKVSPEAQELVRLGFLCHTPNNERVSSELLILRFLRRGFKLRSKIMGNYSCDEYVGIIKRVSNIKHEAHLFTGFVRFSVIDNLLFAKISPKNSVLPLIVSHFADRYKNEMFIIYDDVHSLALIYKPFSYVIVDANIEDVNSLNSTDTDALIVPNSLVSSSSLSQDEQKYQKLWKVFYDSIAIEGRYNPKCRMSHMPKRFWHNLTELKDEAVSK